MKEECKNCENLKNGSIIMRTKDGNCRDCGKPRFNPMKEQKKERKVVTKKMATSQIFACLSCEEQWEGQSTAKMEAKKHTKKTGHKTMGDVTNAYHFTLE